MNVQDHIFRVGSGGWYCYVNGKTFGPWQLREYALAGMQTEQRRAEAKKQEAAEAALRG